MKEKSYCSVQQYQNRKKSWNFAIGSFVARSETSAKINNKLSKLRKMENLNRVELRGVVGNVKVQTVSDNRVYRFTLATSRAYKDKNGTAVIETTWHQVVAWENDNMPDLSQIEKGSKLYVSGRIRNQKYLNSEDVEKQVVEVVANRVVFVESQEPLAYEM